MNSHKNPSTPVRIPVSRITDPRGDLSYVQNDGRIPFRIERAYWIYGVPEGGERGGHSHYVEERLIIAVAGSFDVVVDDGITQTSYHLDSPSEALYVPPGLWRTIEGFSQGAVLLALCSNLYDEVDYVRDYSEYLKLRGLK